MRNGDAAERPDLQGLIGEGTSLSGEIAFEGGYRVDGRITGRLTSRSTLIVGPTGEINAEEATVGSLLVSGAVSGNLFVAERLEIERGGSVTGTVTLAKPCLVMSAGAVFDATLIMAPDGQKPGGAVS